MSNESEPRRSAEEEQALADLLEAIERRAAGSPNRFLVQRVATLEADLVSMSETIERLTAELNTTRAAGDEMCDAMLAFPSSALTARRGGKTRLLSAMEGWEAVRGDEPVPARCDPARGVHVTPHRGCVLR